MGRGAGDEERGTRSGEDRSLGIRVLSDLFFTLNHVKVMT